MDAVLAYNSVVDECFKFSITMLLNSTIMLVIVLHYASICSYASILLLCSKLCQHNSPRPTQKACWGEFSIVIHGNMVYVQTAAASHTGEIPSCLDTDPEFQHRPFQQWQIELRPTLLDTGQSGRLPPGT